MPPNLPRNSHSKQKTRKQNDDVASRTRSKTGHLEQNVGNRTRSKLQAICNSSSQEVFFPLYDIVMFENNADYKDVDLHLGLPECQIYHSALIGSKSQTELDCLLQLHILDKSENDQNKSWKCTKVLKYCEELGVNTSTNHTCLVEWNDINRSQSWVNFFALSLSNPTPIITFARNQNLLHKMPFQHLVQYCKTKTHMAMTRVHKASSSPTGIKYKFGIQVPKGIKNAINLDKKNGNNLWEEAIKTELKQLTDYQTFIVLDSGEDIPKGYQKIP